MMNRLTKVLLATISSLLILLFGAARYSAKRTQREAEAFFRSADRLTVGTATAGDVLKVVGSARGRLNGFGPCVSGARTCLGTVLFTNDRYLMRLHLVEPMIFSSWFKIDNGKLLSCWFQMSYATPRGEVATFIHQGQNTHAIPNEVDRTPEEKYFKISGGHPAGYLGVMVTPEAPERLRQLAYTFNFDCLSKIGGCKTFEEMLPVLAQKELYWGQDPWTHEIGP
jgi:hypothetical protein